MQGRKDVGTDTLPPRGILAIIGAFCVLAGGDVRVWGEGRSRWRCRVALSGRPQARTRGARRGCTVDAGEGKGLPQGYGRLGANNLDSQIGAQAVGHRKQQRLVGHPPKQRGRPEEVRPPPSLPPPHPPGSPS